MHGSAATISLHVVFSGLFFRWNEQKLCVVQSPRRHSRPFRLEPSISLAQMGDGARAKSLMIILFM